MHPEITFELKMSFVPAQEQAPLVKERVQSRLRSLGEPSYVEGVVDGLDLDFDYDHDQRDYFEELGGAVSPISVFKYDRNRIFELKDTLEKEFSNDLQVQVIESSTEQWMEGWKESFRPFSTKQFYVYPPWEQNTADQQGLKPLVIEPGMAFGTGQHATTQLCLHAIEDLCEARKIETALDVGTGTGILSIALHKLGCSKIVATDIDPDSVIATKENAAMNEVGLKVSQESVPLSGSYDLVIANILFVVIRKILPELKARMNTGASLLLSGILSEELEDLENLAAQLDLDIMRLRELDGWVAVLLKVRS